MEKNGRIGGLFVRLFTESRSLSRDALEILLASQRVETGKIPCWKYLIIHHKSIIFLHTLRHKKGRKRKNLKI